MRRATGLILLACHMLLAGCTTVNVDQLVVNQAAAVDAGEVVVVLGRRQNSRQGTKESWLGCLNRVLEQKLGNARIMDEQSFRDNFYPWFEARTAPLHAEQLQTLMARPLLARRLADMRIRHLVWVEGETNSSNSSGTMSCAISPAGGGCFGIASWEDTGNYEAVVWDLRAGHEVGRVGASAVGTSYVPALVVPLPLLARVRGRACQGLGTQLARMLSG